jgi:hypothetical protein
VSAAAGVTFDEAKHLYHDGRGGLVPNVTYILRAVGAAPPVRWYARKALVRGRAVHRAIELFMRHDLDLASVPKVAMPYFETFLDWLDKHGHLTRWRTEVVVHNRARGYAGRADVECMDGPTPVTLDWKTGDPEPWHQVQGMLYGLTGDRVRTPFTVYLGAKGSWQTVTPVDQVDLVRKAHAVLDTFDLARPRHLAELARMAEEDERL